MSIKATWKQFCTAYSASYDAKTAKDKAKRAEKAIEKTIKKQENLKALNKDTFNSVRSGSEGYL